MLFFVTGLYLDGNSHSIVAEAYIADKSPESPIIETSTLILLNHDELTFWKHALPAMVERCRTWDHISSCEYSIGIPVSVEGRRLPICSCGQGKVGQGFNEVAEWKSFAPYVTRLAIAPIFAVPYLEPVRRLPTTPYTTRTRTGEGEMRCNVCGKHGSKKCARCENVMYCSRECQRKDWKIHKTVCKS